MSDDYRAALTAAIQEYESLGVKRREIDERLGQLAQTIGTLSRLLGLTPTVPMGITDACRLVLRGGLPMTPVEVRDRLMAIGVDLSVYSNDLSAIHTVLKRLNEAGEIRLIPRSSGKHAYLWQRPATAIGDESGDCGVRARHEPADSTARSKEQAMNDLSAQRRFYAEEIQMAANLRSPAIVEALAAVPREQFLPPGPWTIRSEADLQGGPRTDAGRGSAARLSQHRDRHRSVARRCSTASPDLLSMAIDSLELEPGARVLHLGTGTGYYTAVMAFCVGPKGHVLGLEVDAAARRDDPAQPGRMPWVDMRQGDGSSPLGEPFDAILINAGVTHPQAPGSTRLHPADEWSCR